MHSTYPGSNTSYSLGDSYIGSVLTSITGDGYSLVLMSVTSSLKSDKFDWWSLLLRRSSLEIMNLTGWGYCLITDETPFLTVDSKTNLSSLNLEVDILAISFFSLDLLRIRLFFLSWLICSFILPATVTGLAGFLQLLMIPLPLIFFGFTKV